jgi:hypothetical protein
MNPDNPTGRRCDEQLSSPEHDAHVAETRVGILPQVSSIRPKLLNGPIRVADKDISSTTHCQTRLKYLAVSPFLYISAPFLHPLFEKRDMPLPVTMVCQETRKDSVNETPLCKLLPSSVHFLAEYPLIL